MNIPNIASAINKINAVSSSAVKNTGSSSRVTIKVPDISSAVNAIKEKSIVYPQGRNLTISAKTAGQPQSAPVLRALTENEKIVYNAGQISNKLSSLNPIQQIKNAADLLKTLVTGTKDQKAAQALAFAEETAKNPVYAANLHAANSVALSLPGILQLTGQKKAAQNMKKLLDISQKQHPAASFLGETAGYVLPGGATDAGIHAIARPIIAKTGATLAGRIATEAAAGALSNAAVSGISDKMQGESNQQTLKDAAVQGVIGAALGGGGKALSESGIIPKAVQAIKNAALGESDAAARTTAEMAAANANRVIPPKTRNEPEIQVKTKTGIEVNPSENLSDAKSSEPVLQSTAKENEVFNTLMDANKKVQQFTRERDNLYAKYLLTDDEKTLAKDVATGRRSIESLPQDARRVTIAEVASKIRQLNDAKKILTDYNIGRKNTLIDNMTDLIKNSDRWKDKPKLAYGRETWDRNITDIAGELEGTKIKESVFTPIHENEASRIRFVNEGRNMVRNMRLSDAESRLVQKIGEGMKDEKDIPEGMDHAKIMGAVSKMRAWYDKVYDDINHVLVKNGYKPVPKRSNYFPHFEGSDTMLDKLKSVFGLNLESQELPTDINGITHNFKPGKRWFGNFLQRTGNKTTFDAVEGFDRYIEGVSHVLYHTDDIQNMRAFTRAIRLKYSDDGIREAINKIYDSEIPEVMKEDQVDELLKNGRTQLSNAVSDLEDYTQVLAGKKSLPDRALESLAGRKIYTLASDVENRIARNMVAINPGSWLTNFIPLTQAAATDDAGSVVKAMTDTIKSLFKDDGFVNQSSFLTNRAGSDPLKKTWFEKATDITSAPMRWIDEFTSNVVTRAKYNDLIKRGSSVEEAMKSADEWAAKAIGDRSFAAQPTIFNAKNPLQKLFTQLQLETNNQLSFLLKDIPKELKRSTVSRYASTIFKIAIFSYLYNEGYQALTGRRITIDPIGEAVGLHEDLTGKRLPIQLSYWTQGAVNKNTAANGKGKLENTLGNVGSDIANNIPFIAVPAGALGFTDVGRLPISSAIPNVANIVQGKGTGKELEKPAAYLLPPFGGGQIKKTAEGISAAVKGGDYSQTKNGPELKYPVQRTPTEIAQAAIFGKWSLPDAQGYVNGGFKPLSVKNTQAYRSLVSSGVKPTVAFSNLKSLSALKPEGGKKTVSNSQKISAIADMPGMTDEEKVDLVRLLMEQPNQKTHKPTEEIQQLLGGYYYQ